MKNNNWFFKEKEHNAPGRDITVGNLFSKESKNGIIPNVVENLIRETIQNSLDANEGNKLPLEIIFSLQNAENGVPSDKYDIYNSSLKEHIEGEKENPNNNIEDLEIGNHIPYISIEDFNTTGLTGHTYNPKKHDDNDVINKFSVFWRNPEGVTGKNEGERGKWGIGKVAIPLSSKIKSFYGVTVTDENTSKLMGLSLMGLHEIKSKPDTTYHPYGTFGKLDDVEFKGKSFKDHTIPILDDNNFNQIFKSKRNQKNGLSLFIPFPVDDFKYEYIIFACIDQFYYTILEGGLKIEIIHNNKSIKIDQDNILQTVDNLKSEKPDDEIEKDEWVRINEYLIKKIEFIEEIKKINTYSTLNPIEEDKKARWVEKLWAEIDLNEIKQNYFNGEIIGFKVPLWIKNQNGNNKLCYYSVFIRKNNNSEDPINEFIRNGLIISENTKSEVNNKGFEGLLIIEPGDDGKNKELSKMVGLTENVAHTEWNPNQTNFTSENYIDGKQAIKFVLNTFRSIYSKLNENDTEVDENFFSDIFPIYNSEGSDGAGKPGIKSKTKAINIHRINNGISISKNPSYDKELNNIELKIAYKIKRGNSFNHYNEKDFKLNSQRIQEEGHYISEVTIIENLIKVKIENQNFKLKIDGFDKNRDLDIKSSHS